MKKIIKIIALILIIIGFIEVVRVNLRNYIFDKENAVVEAISYPEAILKVLKEDYYIIYYKKGFFDDGSTLYYFDGKKKGAVILTGQNPYRLHSSNGNAAIFCGPADNKFLVKGKIEEKYKDIVDETVINVESWDIIAPIKRYYIDEYDHRYLYPITFIDAYDVERGDFTTDAIDNTLYYFEAEYYLNDEEDYLLVSPEIENGEIHWYLCEKESPDSRRTLTKQIELAGNLPEDQYDMFLEEEIAKDSYYSRYYILIKGEYEDEIFNVESWKFVPWIY